MANKPKHSNGNVVSTLTAVAPSPVSARNCGVKGPTAARTGR